MYCVYKFKDNNENVVYVGKTVCIDARMKQHFGTKGHLESEAYKEVKKIEYIELPSKIDMDIKELYFINKYKPKNNKMNKQMGPLILKIDETDDWKVYKDKKERHLEQIKEGYKSIKKSLEEKERELQSKNEEISYLKKLKLPKEKEVIHTREKVYFEINQTPNQTKKEDLYAFSEVKELLQCNGNLMFLTKVIVNGLEKFNYVVYWENGKIMARDMMENKEIILEEKDGAFWIPTISEQALLSSLDFVPDVESKMYAKNKLKKLKEEERVRRAKITLLRSLSRKIEDVIYKRHTREEIDELMEFLWENKEDGEVEVLAEKWVTFMDIRKESTTKI